MKLRMPRGISSQSATEYEGESLTTGHWMSTDQLDALIDDGTLIYDDHKIWLGRDIQNDTPIGYTDDRHCITIAGSRSGKGRSGIIPNLCLYPGSVVCIDPKGENLKKTADRRGLGKSTLDKCLKQEVRILDPFEISDAPTEYISSFNPVSLVNAQDTEAPEVAGLIADAMIIKTSSKDSHWDDTARDLLAMMILHIATDERFEGHRTLATLRELITCTYANLGDIETEEGEPVIFTILETMFLNTRFQGIIRGMALAMLDMGNNERGSVLSTARRNTRFLDSAGIKKVLEDDDDIWTLDDLKTEKRGLSLYLVLPQRYMTTHARWLRLIITLIITRMEACVTQPQTGHPVLAILDEFNVLGHLSTIETAAGYMAGFGLKLDIYLQDISQLKRHYKETWETFLGNAGTITSFGNTDMSTLTYISSRLGDTEIARNIKNTSTNITRTTSDPSGSEKLEKIKGEGVFSSIAKGLTADKELQSHSVAISNSTVNNKSIIKTALLTPEEMTRLFSRESNLKIVMLAGHHPLILKRTNYDQDSFFEGKHDDGRHFPVVR